MESSDATPPPDSDASLRDESPLNRSILAGTVGGALLGAVFGVGVIVGMTFDPKTFNTDTSIGEMVLGLVLFSTMFAVPIGGVIGASAGIVVGLLAWGVASVTALLPWSLRRVLVAVVPPASAFAVMHFRDSRFLLFLGIVAVVVAVSAYVAAPRALRGLRGVPPPALSSRTTVSMLVLVAVAAGMVVPIAPQLQHFWRERARPDAAQAFDTLLRDCAKSAVADTSETVTAEDERTYFSGTYAGRADALRESRLRLAMATCASQRRDQLAGPTGWRVYCTAGSQCLAEAPANWGSGHAPLVTPVESYLDEALRAAGRPGWARFQDPVPQSRLLGPAGPR